MRSVTFGLICVASVIGCGRLDFDAAPPATGAPPDAQEASDDQFVCNTSVAIARVASTPHDLGLAMTAGGAGVVAAWTTDASTVLAQTITIEAPSTVTWPAPRALPGVGFATHAADDNPDLVIASDGDTQILVGTRTAAGAAFHAFDRHLIAAAGAAPPLSTPLVSLSLAGPATPGGPFIGAWIDTTATPSLTISPLAGDGAPSGTPQSIVADVGDSVVVRPAGAVYVATWSNTQDSNCSDWVFDQTIQPVTQATNAPADGRCHQPMIARHATGALSVVWRDGAQGKGLLISPTDVGNPIPLAYENGAATVDAVNVVDAPNGFLYTVGSEETPAGATTPGMLVLGHTGLDGSVAPAYSTVTSYQPQTPIALVARGAAFAGEALALSIGNDHQVWLSRLCEVPPAAQR